MRRTALIALGLITAMLFFAVWLLVVSAVVKWSWNYLFASPAPVTCSVAANLIGRTDALFACLMQR